MRSFDYAPLYRTTVGFDRLFDMLDSSVRSDWPPYNIEKTGDNDYRITMAVAGFSPEEVELTQHGPELIVIGQKQPEQGDRQILHRGMATRNFKQVFRLADYVKVADATLENGLLSVDLVREIPEELKPRRIGIGTSTGKQPSPNKQISQDTQPQRKVA
ncbi:Hsp20 family protein [Mesorhizobium sp. IMUNJ 23033]|uniref:Hsp20 family protein n=1 Tax=Mesorhizobium sp. IMUNJ 23033 TaxID=3378039 RepID=UPI0038509ADF